MLKYILLISLCFSNAWAGFDLFNQDRGKPPEPPPAPVQPPAPAPTPAPPPAPRPPPPPQKDFVLKGTTKFGKNYQIFLQTPDGKDIIHEWKNTDKTSEIEGFKDFSILNVTPREVVIRYPENSLCLNSHLDRGVMCATDQKTATLKLVRGAPTPPKPVAQLPSATPITPATAAGGGLVPNNNPNAPAPSPEAQRLQALFQQAAQQNQPQTQPSPLKPGENPPAGMKVVKTPFGDRLVPEAK
jgi:hypothetical protein